MGFRHWLSEKLSDKTNVRPEPPVVPTGEVPLPASPDAARVDEWASALSVSPGRAARLSDFEAMDQGDFAALLDAVVDAALTFDEFSHNGTEADRPDCFKLQATKSRHTKAIEAILVSSQIKSKLRVYLRYLLKYGDLFVEPLIAKDNSVAGVQSYHPRRMYVYTDEHNRLLTGTQDGFPLPYQQRNSQNAIKAGWAPWELIHWKWLPSDQYAYSEKGLLDDYRADWKKLQALELAMVIARGTRAYPRHVHGVDTTGQNRIEAEGTLREYVRRVSFRNRRQQSNGAYPAPDEDFYISKGYLPDGKGDLHPRLNEIQTIDPLGAGFSAIGDIQYIRRKVFSRVPGEVIGITDTASREITAQDLAFNRLIRYTQSRVEDLVRDVVDLGLVLNGYEIGSVPYYLQFPKTLPSNWKFADAAFRTAMSYQVACKSLGLARRDALKRMYGMTDDEITATFGETEKEVQQLGPVDPKNVTGKIVGGNQSTESLDDAERDLMEAMSA